MNDITNSNARNDNQIYLTADRFPLIRDIGMNRVIGAYTHPDRLLEFDVFLFVAEGSMQVFEAGNEYIVKANEHLFLKRGLHHWGKPVILPDTTWYWIHFNSPRGKQTHYQELIPFSELGYTSADYYQYTFPLPKYGSSPWHRTLEDRLQRLLEEFAARKPHGMTWLSLHICELFLELEQAANSHPHPESDPINKKADTLVGKVLQYLTLHAESDFDSHKLSAALHLNYSYLSTTFKKKTGQTIVEAHTKLRVNRAIELIRTTSLNVTEISERLGYSNPYYFSRVFKKSIGESPSLFMKRYYRT